MGSTLRLMLSCPHLLGLVLLGLTMVAPVQAGTPLAPGHYGGPATATWAVSSEPSWLVGAALKVLAKKEGLDRLPAEGSCEGVIGLDVPDAGDITGKARCEFPGELALYNDRVLRLDAVEAGAGLEGSATCCGLGRDLPWKARRVGDGFAGTAKGSESVEAVSVETRLGSVEVSLRVDWSVRFAAQKAAD